ncbi:CD1871A family CXXC motif-containing protein [Treponema sp.]|uniref:CD1871A family CXXC motif-containing protein n=1 Tax=Treponema sp. TaxID=166 RepID=UPI0025FFEC7C|nr:CD1871A family CXXC motif-containing protein [Treponema sp.]MCR5218987.1 hypothetical protein [Treponema sp.]
MKKGTLIRHLISFLMLVTGVLLILAGIYREEAEVVFNKATRICLECIGIG